MVIKNKSSIIFLFTFFLIIFQFQFFSINSSLLNHIIKLGDNPFRYNQFSFNSEGDMILNTGAYPIQKERKFFGIKKNGRGYFSDNAGNNIYQISMSSDSTPPKGRIEGESCFIKLNSTNSTIFGKELILGVSKDGDDTRTEFYDLNERKLYGCNTLDIFKDLDTHAFTLIPDPLNKDKQFNYIISYIERPNKLYTKKINFYFNDYTDKGENHVL